MITMITRSRSHLTQNVKSLDYWKVLLLLGSNDPHHDTMSSAYPSVTFSCLLKIQCYFAQMITIMT